MKDRFIIKKSFHFHAAHRNEDIPTDRCFSIHGHTYYLDCHFAFLKEPEQSLTMLFSEIEKCVMPVVEAFEHSFIINRADPLYPVLKDHGIKLCVLDHTSSAENLAKLFFDRIRAATGLELVQVDFKETTSSIVTYQGTKGY